MDCSWVAVGWWEWHWWVGGKGWVGGRDLKGIE